MANVGPSYGQSQMQTHGVRSVVAAAPMGKDVATEHQLMGVVDDQLKKKAAVQCYGNVVQTSTDAVQQAAEVLPFSYFAGGEPRTPVSFEMLIVEVQK